MRNITTLFLLSFCIFWGCDKTPFTKGNSTSDGGIVDNGLIETHRILGERFSISINKNLWQLVSNDSLRTEFSGQENYLVLTDKTSEQTLPECSTEQTQTSHGLSLSNCGDHQILLTDARKSKILAEFGETTPDLLQIIDSIKPIFEKGHYLMKIAWNKEEVSFFGSLLPPPYKKGEKETSLDFEITDSPNAASDSEAPMEGYHEVVYGYSNTETCTNQGMGYTWKDGSFWFLNCDPRGTEATYSFGDINYFYWNGHFTRNNSGEGIIYLVKKNCDSTMLDCGNPVGKFTLEPK